jgi:hypothetical protein
MQNISDWLHRHSALIVFLVMVLLTTVTYSADRFGLSGIGLVLAVLVIALFKGQLVVDYFMGLRQVRWFWRTILYGYLVVVGASIAIAFVLVD